MDIKRLRHMNARHLLKTETEGVNDFSYKVGRSQSLISAYLSERPSKNIGDKMARVIEEAFGKEHGWLDTPHEGIDPDQKRLRDMAAHSFGDLPSDQSTPIMMLAKIGAHREEIDHHIKQLDLQRNELSYKAHIHARELLVAGLEHHGFTLEEDNQSNRHHRSRFSNFASAQPDQFDFVFLDPGARKVGFYVWVAFNGYRTPHIYLPKFIPPIEAVDTESRLALFYVHGENVCFFLVPISLISDLRQPMFRVRHDPSDGVTYYRIGSVDITQFLNKFDIQIEDVPQKERIKRLRDMYLAEIKRLEDKI